MRIAAVVCTYNRSRFAAEALESLFHQTLAREDYEVILVNDGSKDDTQQLSIRYASQPNFHYLEQKNQGLSAARNAGFVAASAPIVAFLDDDATAESQWLAVLAEAAQRLPSDVACFGGPIELTWELPRPPWLDHRNLIWLGAFDCGSVERVEVREGLFRGGNMAFRRDVLVRLGGFSLALGRIGANLLSHEESAIGESLHRLGLSCAYLPDARIRHWVPRERLRQSWFRRRVYWEGVSIARRQRLVNPIDSALRRWMRAANYFRVRFFARETLVTAIRPWRWASDLPWQCHLCYHWGVIVESLHAP